MTDGQTDGQTEISSQDRVCIPCSAVKTTNSSGTENEFQGQDNREASILGFHSRLKFVLCFERRLDTSFESLKSRTESLSIETSLRTLNAKKRNSSVPLMSVLLATESELKAVDADRSHIELIG